jgi:DNA-binding response OmpR family regulator
MNIQTILIVDDSKPLVYLLKEHIAKSFKYVVEIAFNGKEALEVLDGEEIDLIILDIEMPIMDGLQLLAELHNRKIWLPVIVLTAKKIDLSETKFREFGIVDFIQKPFEFEILDKRIDNVLKKRENKDSISGISLFGILQILEMERKTGILSLKIGDINGKIFFRDGKVADIEAGDLSLEKALKDCITAGVEKQKISIEYINHTREIKVNRSLTEMLIEASRLLDEENKSEV